MEFMNCSTWEFRYVCLVISKFHIHQVQIYLVYLLKDDTKELHSFYTPALPLCGLYLHVHKMTPISPDLMFLFQGERKEWQI